MTLIRSLAAATTLALAASAAFADDYTLVLAPATPTTSTSSFAAAVNGLFIDKYSFTPAAFDGHVAVSFAALTPSVAFFVAELNGQTFSFFPGPVPMNFDIEADVTAGVPLLLTIFGAALDDMNAFTSGRYSVDVVASVPEPSTYALVLAGFGVVAWAARRRRPTRTTG